MARNLEPYRGFHVFMRALETLQRLHPTVHAVIVGGDEVSYGRAPKDAPNWRVMMLREVKLDASRWPVDWAWSGCRAHLGLVPAPSWLDSDSLHAHLMGRPVANTHDRHSAAARYRDLVDTAQAADAHFWQDALHGQIYLGDEQFAQTMQARAEPQRLEARTIPRAQRTRLTVCDWAMCLACCGGDRAQALHWGYTDGGMTMTELSRQSGISLSHVSRLIARVEKGAGG